MKHILSIASTWDGKAIVQEQQSTFFIDTTKTTSWSIQIDAPYYGDPAPMEPVGHTEQLWEYEVVELFLLSHIEKATNPHYLELEFSPHGHHLVLELRGIRNRVAEHRILDFTASIRGNRWFGSAQLPTEWLPTAPLWCNAYGIHGQGEHRDYLAMLPSRGEKPDFHRLDCFGKLEQFQVETDV